MSETTPSRPESSIVIPAYNKWDLTRKCLKSVAANTDNGKIEVIVVAKPSSDVTRNGCEFLGRKLFGENFRYIRNEENRNFAGAFNQGAETARGEFLIFLNNATEVQPGWYEPLIEDFTTWPNIAATGPLVVYPDETPLGRTVQHLGVFVSPFMRVGHLYEGIPAESPMAKRRRFFQVITATCMIIKKSLFMEIGKFDEGFVNGFEDVDLCARLTSKGYRMTVNPEAMVVYHESQSAGRHDWEKDNSAYLREKSLSLLKPDWHLHIEDDGLMLAASKWQSLNIVLPAEKSISLAPRPDLLTETELKQAVTQAPYWENGWNELLRHGRNNAQTEFLANTYLKFFPNPENILELSGMPWARNNCDWLAVCHRRLLPFFVLPENYLANMRDAMKLCAARGLHGMARQFASLAADYDSFCENEFAAAMRGLWRIERKLGKTHSPNDPVAYALWLHAADGKDRRREISGFMRNVAVDPEPLPYISILMPVYNPKPEHLRAALDSVLAQTYAKWELCVANDASTDPRTAKILEEYAGKDPRMRVVKMEANGHVAAVTNTALNMASHSWSALMDQDGLLTEDALAFAAMFIMANPDALLFFSDEDRTVDGKEFFEPHLKSGKWDRELFVVQNYVCHLAVCRTDRMREIGGFRSDFPGAQNHDFLLRYTAGGRPGQFVHISRVLYHWRSHEAITSSVSSSQASQAFLDAHEPGAVVEALPSCPWMRIRHPLPSPLPSVSIVCAVPGPSFPLRKYHGAWAGKTELPFEAVFVCAEEDYTELTRRFGSSSGNVRILKVPGGLSKIRRLRLGAEAAKGEILGFVDPDVVPVDADWLGEIVSCLCRDDVGVVGGKVSMRDGSMADAGYMADAGGSLKPVFADRRPGMNSWFGWTRLARTVDAVNGSCLFTKSGLFRDAGGFDERMLAWCAQDYCLRLGRNALSTIWSPYCGFVRLNPAVAGTEGVVEFSKRWRGKIRPFNERLLVLGGGMELADPDDKTYDFSAVEYLTLYPDVGRSGMEPLAHYLRAGIPEGRKGRLSRVDYSGLTLDRIASWKMAPESGVVVCTSLCGDYEKLLPPAHLNDGWRYVCYSDRPRDGHGIWEIRQIPYKNDDMTRRSRWAKMNLPFIFPDAKWVFWLDANIIISGDLSPLLKVRGEEPGLWMVRHPVRECVFQEANACIVSKRDDAEILKRQVDAYAATGMPENFGMWENGCFLVDPSSEKARSVFADWWKEYDRYGKRDQISLPYVFFSRRFLPGELFPGGKTARSWPDLTFLTHEETFWVPLPTGIEGTSFSHDRFLTIFQAQNGSRTDGEDDE